MPIQVTTNEHTSILLPEINHELGNLIKTEWFDSDFWKLQGAISGRSIGRNITWFITHKDSEWVLRHYYRGGMMSRLFHDKYWFSDFEDTRCYREMALMQQMYQQGLAVPKPIAGRVQKLGVFYRADLLMEKIPGASDLVSLLKKHPLNEADWRATGSAIAKFHRSGIYHADLNAHNIMLDKNSKVWLIDFDRCENRTPSEVWQKDNLARLKRSFLKELGLHEKFHFKAREWQWLLEAYKNF